VVWVERENHDPPARPFPHLHNARTTRQRLPARGGKGAGLRKGEKGKFLFPHRPKKARKKQLAILEKKGRSGANRAMSRKRERGYNSGWQQRDLKKKKTFALGREKIHAADGTEGGPRTSLAATENKGSHSLTKKEVYLTKGEGEKKSRRHRQSATLKIRGVTFSKGGKSSRTEKGKKNSLSRRQIP